MVTGIKARMLELLPLLLVLASQSAYPKPLYPPPSELPSRPRHGGPYVLPAVGDAAPVSHPASGPAPATTTSTPTHQPSSATSPGGQPSPQPSGQPGTAPATPPSDEGTLHGDPGSAWVDPGTDIQIGEVDVDEKEATDAGR